MNEVTLQKAPREAEVAANQSPQFLLCSFAGRHPVIALRIGELPKDLGCHSLVQLCSFFLTSPYLIPSLFRNPLCNKKAGALTAPAFSKQMLSRY